MPLFMDYHKGLSVSVEDVKKAHMADEAVQHKYGVIYHQFWVNEQEGAVFCLMEGPDKESCAAVHREAHGGVACSIVEVAMGFYELFMGNGHVVEQGHVRRVDGTADLGIRNILVINIQGATNSMKNPAAAKELTLSCVSQFHGREVTWLHVDSLVAVFDNPVDSVNCALALQRELSSRGSDMAKDEWNIMFRIGLSSGQPVTEACELFADTITTARRLSSIANANEILISPTLLQFCNVKELVDGSRSVRILSTREQDFITNLFSISEEKLSDECFTVDTLCRDMGVSRPQLYRKVVFLTGKSPHDFIRDLRMERALTLLRRRAGNVSEIALEVGYNNPSYFARCFQSRFGCTPSRLGV